MKVINMKTSKGNMAVAQIMLKDYSMQIENNVYKGTLFKSYGENIAFKTEDNRVFLDKFYWNYSATTGKYRNRFLEENIKATRKKIKLGEYKLVDLSIL